jgi:hypothetical protein
MSFIGILLFLWIVGGAAALFGYFSSRDRAPVVRSTPSPIAAREP